MTREPSVGVTASSSALTTSGTTEVPSFSFEQRSLTFDADKKFETGDHCRGVGRGLPILVALAGLLLEGSVNCGLIGVAPRNLAGPAEMIPNSAAIAEDAVEIHAADGRRQLNDTTDELWAKNSIDLDRDRANVVFEA